MLGCQHFEHLFCYLAKQFSMLVSDLLQTSTMHVLGLETSGLCSLC